LALDDLARTNALGPGRYRVARSINLRPFDEREIGLSVSMPLGTNNTRLSMDARRSGEQWSECANLSGTFDQNRYSYNASLDQSGAAQRTAALSLGYRGPFATVGAGYSRGSNYDSLSVNASGALLAHAGGFARSPGTRSTTKGNDSESALSPTLLSVTR